MVAGYLKGALFPAHELKGALFPAHELKGALFPAHEANAGSLLLICWSFSGVLRLFLGSIIA